jgi:HD-like signal output (HDOD) protein
LNQALEKRPETVRFLLAYEADLALVAAKVLKAPHIVSKPIDPASLKSRIEGAFTNSESKEAEDTTLNGDSDSPTVPPIYSEVLKALESAEVTHKQLGEIIGRDPALTSEVLRLTNSTHLGLPRNITDPGEAIKALGLEPVKALVMALQFLAEHSRVRPGYLSVDQIWLHSVNVGQIARDLVLFETKDRTLASQALIAGLLHDLGKVVLATNFDDLYGRVHSLARKQPVTLWDVEREMFGASHGEIGACLLGMWNMPAAIVDAVALHHEPPLNGDQQLTPLAAVHIANVLERELGSSDDDVMVASIINTPFLNQLGLLQRLPVWRAAFANRRAEDFEQEVESVETTSASRTANYLPGPGASTHTATSGHPWTASGNGRIWAYASVAAVVLVLLAVWLTSEPDFNNNEPAYARTPTQFKPPTDSSSTPSREKVLETTPSVASSTAVQEEPTAPAASVAVVPPPVATPSVATAPVATPSASAATEPESAASRPAPEPVAAAAPAVTAPTPAATNAPANVALHEKPHPEFRLNAIFYTAVRPSAILNGETVNVGDELNGATVVAIGRTSVTLQVNGQRKVYELK